MPGKGSGGGTGGSGGTGGTGGNGGNDNENIGGDTGGGTGGDNGAGDGTGDGTGGDEGLIGDDTIDELVIAMKDPYGYPESLARDINNNLTPLAVEPTNRALRTTEGKRLLQVINLDLSVARTAALYDIAANEIAIVFISPGILTLYPDANIDSRGMYVNNNISLSIYIQRFYITNTAQPGVNAQVWLFE